MSDSVFRSLVLILLSANLVVSALLLIRGESASLPVVEAEEDADIDRLRQTRMEALAIRLQQAFNAVDGEAMYALYGDEARSKLTVEQVVGQLESLSGTFGRIEGLRYLNYIELGEQGNEVFLQAHFAIQVTAPGLSGAQMMLHIIDHGNGEFSLYGMRLNAGQS